jgi:predicted phage terminase large subunit-like protein
LNLLGLTREQIAAAVANMTDDEIAVLEDLRREHEARRKAERIRNELLPFVEWSHPGYSAGWFHRDVCQRLERFSAAVARGESPRLILCAPPRHGKSVIVSRRWPVWHLGHHPKHEVVVASYGQELANQASRDARNVAVEAARWWPTLAEGDTWGVEYWKTRGGGSYKAVGAGGPLTGSGAHVMILDDLVKDAEAANSQVQRDALWDWYQTTAYTRLAPGGGVLAMFTRWHHDDPIGRLLKAQDEGGDRWEVVVYPALAEEDEPHRKAGEALHPERYDRAALLRIKAAVGARVWAALFQQRPTPGAGLKFQRQWFKTYDAAPWLLAPTLDEILVSVDAAQKKGASNDYCCLQAWGRKGANKYLLDQVRDRMEITDLLPAFDRFCAKWPTARVKLVEDKSHGTTLIQMRRDEIEGIVPYDPQTDGAKEARAGYTQLAGEAGQLWVPDAKYAPWVGDFVEEHLAFPLGAHDDQVDTASQVMIRWMGEEAESAMEKLQRELGFLGSLGVPLNAGPLGFLTPY